MSDEYARYRAFARQDAKAEFLAAHALLVKKIESLPAFRGKGQALFALRRIANLSVFRGPA